MLLACLFVCFEYILLQFYLREIIEIYGKATIPLSIFCMEEIRIYERLTLIRICALLRLSYIEYEYELQT